MRIYTQYELFTNAGRALVLHTHQINSQPLVPHISGCFCQRTVCNVHVEGYCTREGKHLDLHNCLVPRLEKPLQTALLCNSHSCAARASSMPNSQRLPTYAISHGGGPWPWMKGAFPGDTSAMEAALQVRRSCPSQTRLCIPPCPLPVPLLPVALFRPSLGRSGWSPKRS